SLWPSWFSKNRRFIAWAFVPIDDYKPPICFECAAHGLRKANAVRNAVEGIRQENKIGRVSKRRNIVSVTSDKFTIGQSFFHEPMSSDFYQARVNVDCENMLRGFGYLKGEPAVAGA